MLARVIDTTPQPPGFEILPGSPNSTVVIHVPHSSTAIPPWVRERILLNDEQLDHELALMTDADTDRIADSAASQCEVRPWIFVNRLSRLVIDPERFPDPDAEPMARPEIGMGAVYMRTAHLDPLRKQDQLHEQELLDAYFYPYAAALATLIEERLTRVAQLTVIDLHSFPVDELPYEALHHAGADRPELCLGTDEFHTPTGLIAAAREAFTPIGRVTLDQPFAGTYVPLKHYRSDARVSSIMIELRRDQYAEDAGFASTVDMLAALLAAISP
jgi:N-formylglutamate deformylase